MANKKYWLGILAVLLVFGMVVVGCELEPDPEFPSEFRGTWKREGFSNTLTITATTYRLSQQSYYWTLVDVSGDTYYIEPSTGSGFRGTEVIRYVNGTLVIEPCNGTGLDNCGGTWIRQ